MNNSNASKVSLASSLETGPGRSKRLLSATLAVASSLSVAGPSSLANVPLPSPPMPVASWQPHTSVAAPAVDHSSAANQSSLHSSALVPSTLTGLVHSSPLLSHVPAVSGGTNLNLTSTALSYLAGNLANFKSLTIDVGGRQETVNLSTKLTGAEVVAVEQVLSTGSQGLSLSSSGAATGGTVSLNSNLLTALDTSLGGSISSLTIARGVEVVDSLSLLSLSGGLTNYGTIATAASASGSTDKIAAATIFNASGAVIDSFTAAGSSNSSLVAADPNLSASSSVTNNGTIGSAGSLTITAPIVYNVAAAGSAAPSISAANSVNINTQNLTNSGTIAAASGNVNLASTGALSVTGIGGTLQAANGNINFATTNGDINATGGNLLSQQVNFTAGTGNVEANVEQVTGVVNAGGNDLHINASTQNLLMGSIDASGDPLISNASGNVEITPGSDTTPGSGTVTGGSALSIVASGNIVSDGGTINTSSSTAAGGALTLVAGAAITAETGGGIKVTGASSTGGVIDLTGGSFAGPGAPVTTIQTGGTADKAEAGGAITMVAFANNTDSGGQVMIPTNVVINASGTSIGSSVGAAGNVTIIAGATTGSAISTGAIIGKTVTLDTSTPLAASGVTFSSTGVQSGTFTATAIPNAADATVGNVSGTLNANSLGTVSVTNSTSGLTLGTITLGKTGDLVATNTASGANGAIAVDGVITGNNITIASNGTITVTKTITAQSALTIDGGVGTSNSSTNAVVISAAVVAPTINIGLNAGDSGSIALDAAIGSLTGTTITQTVNVTAGSLATGGNITGTSYVYAADSISLGAAGALGTAAKPIETDTPTLSVGATTANKGGAYIAQKGNLSLDDSNSDNLVLKVTGNLDVTGVINAPAMSLTSTGTITIDGTITNAYNNRSNTANPGVILITSAKTFTIDPSGLISTTGDTQPVTINVTGTGAINGAIAVQSLILKTSEALTIGQTTDQNKVILSDGSDSISAKGIITVNGQINDTALSVTTTEAFDIAANAGINVGATSNINALTITNAGTAAGNISYTATASGDSFTNAATGVISGTTVTVNTTSSSGIIDNLGMLTATPPAGSTAVPTLNLIARTVENNGSGIIEAEGNNGVNGALSISSPTTLVITGTTGSFVSGNFGSVSLKASGNITVGSTSTNPFSNLNAANNLGSFSVSTPDIFTSPLTGISVTTNSAGTIGGVISITAASLAYNGSTTPLTQSFSLTTTGQSNAPIATPLFVDLTGSKGLTVGSAAGDYTVNVSGFAASSTTTLSTSQALVIDVASLNSSGTSLDLTGTHSLLIDGFLDQVTSGTSVTLNTSSTANFLVGGATTNGVSGITAGQGIAAQSLTINAPAAIVLQAGSSSAAGAVLDATNGITLYAKGLTVDAYANIVSTGASSSGLTLEAKTGALNYTNLNGTVDTQPDVSLINLTALAGALTVSSGTVNGTQTVLSVGSGTNGPGGAASGGTFNINAESITYGSGGLLLDATNGVNGGVVNIDLAGTTAAKIGTGAGNIGADLASSTSAGNGIFSLTTGGSITGTNLYNTTTPSDSAINFGVAGSGKLILNADGTNSKISLKEITGIDLNTLSLTSHSTTSFVMSGATAGNGIIDGAVNTPAATITAGVLNISNTGEVNLSNVLLSTTTAQQLTINSSTSISLSQQPSLTVGAVSSVAGGTGGVISLTAPILLLNGGGLSLTASGGSSSGGSITVATTSTTTPLAVGSGAGQIAFNVTNNVGDKGGSVSVASGNSLTVNASGLDYGNGINIGASLSLTSGVGSNLLFNNAGILTGLNYGSVTLSSGGSSTFILTGATVNGLGGTGTNSQLNAGAIKITSTNFAAIDATGENLITNSLTLSTGSSVVLPSGTLSVVSDGATGTGNDTRNGGTINITAGTLVGSANTLSAAAGGGNGGSITLNLGTISVSGQLTLNANAAGGAGGSVAVDVSGTSALTVGAGSLVIDVANASGYNGGSVTVTNGGALTVDASSAGINLGGSYAAGGGANLTLASTGSTMMVTFGTTDLSGLGSITLGSNSGQPFALGGANVNGIVDAGLTLNANNISFYNSGGAITNGTLTGLVGLSSISLSALSIGGASGGGINIADSPSVSLVAGGSAFVNSLGTTDFTAANVGGALNIGGAGNDLTVGVTGTSTASFTAGSITISYINQAGSNAATVTLGSMFATGTTASSGISVTSNAKYLVVAANSDITTVDGNITLNNNATLGNNPAATISIGANSIIHASSSVGDISDGNVNIFMGVAGYAPAPGITPGAATVNVTGDGFVTFASVSNTSGTITVGTGDVFSGLDRSLSFNTYPFDSSAITVGNGVVITADPPTASAATAASGGLLNLSAVAGPVSAASSSGSSSPVFAPSSNFLSPVTSTALSTAASSFSGLTPTGPQAGIIGAVSSPASSNSTSTIAGVNNSTVSASSINLCSTNYSSTSVANSSQSKRLTGGVSNLIRRTLEHGPLLLSPSKNQIVDTPFGSVNVAAGSVALIISSDQGLAVYNLHDGHKNAVTVAGSEGTVSLAPGRSFVVAKSGVQSFEQANPAPFVRYRQVSESSKISLGHAYEADFDLVSMLHGLPGVKALISSDNAAQRKTGENMLKTAAILTQISVKNEPYALYLTPSVTACAMSARP